MTSWQPDWNTLNSIAAAMLASTPLAAQIAAITPPGSHVATGLRRDLASILAEAPGAGLLVIAVDTLTVAAGSTSIAASGVQIVARSVQVEGGGAATLNVSGVSGDNAALQLVTADLGGTLAVALGANAAVTFPADPSGAPRLLTLEAAAPTELVVARDGARLADAMHSPWSLLALELTGAVAGVVADAPGPGPLALAESMLRWVSANASALLAHQASFPGVDYADVVSMLGAASALLTSTQTAASGAIYVPILSADMYQSQVTGILALAAIYDGKIGALQAQQHTGQELAAFATTLGSINQQAAGPLLATLRQLAGDSAMLETQLANAALQLQQIGATLPDLQKALTQAIEDQFQQELVSSALNTLFTLATLYLGAAAALLGDPELLAGDATAMMKAALDVTTSLLDAAREPLSEVIGGGLNAAGQPLDSAAFAATEQGGQVLATSMASFGGALNALWTVVGVAIAKAPAAIDYAPDFLQALEAAPNLAGLSLGGVDPVTYWKVVVKQTEAAVQPHLDLAEAQAYLHTVQLAATYGAAIGDLQMKLLDLYAQGVSTFARLQAVYQAQAQWTKLQGLLVKQEDQAQAAIGLLQRGYLNVKRALVSAVSNYRAAFHYQWLHSSDINVDASMDYLTLAQQTQRSVDSLQQVLAGTPSGPVRPRQDFQAITYAVTRDGAALFTEVDGVGQAEWSISTADPVLAAQLGGNHALYLREVTFVLEGGVQDGEVELQVATSGRYESQLGDAPLRFVSQAVSMNNFYLPGTPPSFISSWKFADPAAYMMPTPYTNWTLKVRKGQWREVSAIRMTLSGQFLQNPGLHAAAPQASLPEAICK